MRPRLFVVILFVPSLEINGDARVVISTVKAERRGAAGELEHAGAGQNGVANVIR